MASFKAIDPGVEVSGTSILSFLYAIEFGREMRAEILSEHDIEPTEDSWHNQQRYLDALKQIAENVGEKTMFLMGKAVPESATFPREIQGVEAALNSINVAYQMNHRGDDIGYYKLVEFDADMHRAVMECKNPYPSEFDRGILTTMVRKFTAEKANAVDVVLDTTKPSRREGGDTCWYVIGW